MQVFKIILSQVTFLKILSTTPAPKYGSIAVPIMVVIQNEISLSTMVAAALMDGGTPAAENKIIITPSTAPRPPGRRGIIPSKVEIIKTSAITTGETSTPKAKNTI